MLTSAGTPVRPVEASEKSERLTPVTFSLNVAVQCTVVLAVGDASARTIETTVGSVVSTTKSLFAPSEPAAPGAGSVRFAVFGAFGVVSLIVPPLVDRADVET